MSVSWIGKFNLPKDWFITQIIFPLYISELGWETMFQHLRLDLIAKSWVSYVEGSSLSLESIDCAYQLKKKSDIF